MITSNQSYYETRKLVDTGTDAACMYLSLNTVCTYLKRATAGQRFGCCLLMLRLWWRPCGTRQLHRWGGKVVSTQSYKQLYKQWWMSCQPIDTSSDERRVHPVIQAVMKVVSTHWHKQWWKTCQPSDTSSDESRVNPVIYKQWWKSCQPSDTSNDESRFNQMVPAMMKVVSTQWYKQWWKSCQPTATSSDESRVNLVIHTMMKVVSP